VDGWLCGLWALDYTPSGAVGFEIKLVGLRHYTVGVGLWLSRLACLHAETSLAF
jgi:hypothetical protein